MSLRKKARFDSTDLPGKCLVGFMPGRSVSMYNVFEDFRKGRENGDLPIVSGDCGRFRLMQREDSANLECVQNFC